MSLLFLIILFISLSSFSNGLLSPCSKLIRKNPTQIQHSTTKCFIATQILSFPRQSDVTSFQLQPTTLIVHSADPMFHDLLSIMLISNVQCQNSGFNQQNRAKDTYFLVTKSKNHSKNHTKVIPHHRRGARFNRGGGQQRSPLYYHIHTTNDFDDILTVTRHLSNSVLVEFTHLCDHAATPFTRISLKIFKFLFPSICYVISHNGTNINSQNSEVSLSHQSRRAECPVCHTSQIVLADNITLRKHPQCDTRVTINSLPTTVPTNTSNSSRGTRGNRRINNSDSQVTQNSTNSSELFQAISQLKSKFNKGSKAAVKRQWANEGVGPKFIQLEQVMQTSTNHKENADIQSLLQQILLDTPPYSKIDNSVDNTTSMDSDTLEEFSNDFLPITPAPVITAVCDNFYLIKKALQDGNINKVTRLLDSGGIKSLDTATLTEIKSKFPEVYQTVVTNNLNFSDSNDFVNFMDDGIQLQTIRYLNKQPRNAAKSSLGWSTDHIQDLLYYCPNASTGFFIFLQLIINGQISTTTKALLYKGRGIALIQKEKIRPIIIQCPFHKTASHVLVKSLKTKSIEICGNKQLGSPISGGVEILIHTVRLILELNTDFVIIKTDIKNAFNELSREAIINAVNEQANEILPYVNNLLNEPSEVIFNDKPNKVCAQILQRVGVPQGSPSSGPLFNITQAETLKYIQSEHPNITIISIHDDHYILGKLEHALPALDMFDLEFARLNLKRQQSKSKLYHPNYDYNQIEKDSMQRFNLQIISSSEGIEVAGAPIGSPSFVEDYLFKVVNNIKQQLAKYIDITQVQFSSKKHDSQTLHAIMRKCISSQFTYLLRCCKPSDSKKAAEQLDEALFSFFIHCIDAQQEIQNSNESEVNRIKKQIFLPIRFGGCGLTSSKFINEAAFIGSISLTAHWIGKIIPEICITEENINNSVYPPTIEEFNSLLSTYKEIMPKELENVTLLSIWENKIPKVQHIITQTLYDHEKLNFEQIIKNIDIAAMGETDSQNLNYHQLKARLFKVQHISNKDRHVSAWINSNPADTSYKMNNPAWNIAMKSRLQLNINNNTNLWCLCGEKMDHLCAHSYTCKNKNIYNAMRGPHHKKVKYVLHELISKANSKFKLEGKREPAIEDYFPRVQQNTSNSQSTNNQRTNDDEEENIPGKSIHRGDILLRHNTNGKALIIDVKLTDPFAKFIKEHVHATQPANQGEDIKRKQYSKHYDMQTTESAQMIFLTLTTFGAPSKDTREFVKILFEDEPEETKKFKTQQFYERLSSAVQTIKSLNIQNTIKYHTTNQRPLIPPPHSELPSPFAERRNQLNSLLSGQFQNFAISQISASQNSNFPNREPTQISTFRSDIVNNHSSSSSGNRDTNNSSSTNNNDNDNSTSNSRSTNNTRAARRQQTTDSSRSTSTTEQRSSTRNQSQQRLAGTRSQSQQQSSSLRSTYQQWDHSNGSRSYSSGTHNSSTRSSSTQQVRR